MRTTAWLLPVGLVIALVGGCSSSRFGLAKADPPMKKPVDGDRVEYGNPWKKPKKENTEPSKEMVAEMAKVKKDMEAAKAASNDVTPWLKNAAEAEGKGDLASAKGLYQKILEKDPNNAEAHHRLAVIADQQQDARTADEHYLKALTMNRRDADLLSDMGYSLYLRGKLADSESRLKEALEANPYHRGAQSNLGLVYGRQGKYDQALAAFRQAGTESEAQKNMAQLFPNGRPNGSGTATLAGGTAVADNSNRRAAPALPADVDQRLGEAPFSEVMKKMQQERDAAERVRGQQSQGQLLGQNANPTSPMTNAAPAMNNAGPMNSPNGATANWMADTNPAPPTFNQYGATTPLSTPPNMQPAPNWGTPAPSESTAAVPTNVAKPQENNPFWSGNLGSNPTPAATPPNSSFAMNANPPANFGAGNHPSMNPGLGNPGVSIAPNNEFPPQNFRAPTGDIRQMSYAAPNSTMNDAQRIAAQMAMATGPGALLPVVNPGPTAATNYPSNSTSGVNYAYGETSGNGNRAVENAVWTNPQNGDRTLPTNNASQPNAIAPGSVWSNDWTSPAPATINWGSDASGVPNGSLPPWAVNVNSAAPPANGSATQPPAWNGGNNGAANANTSVDSYRWDGTPVNGQNNNRSRTDGAANTGNGSAPITIPDWPNAPRRP